MRASTQTAPVGPREQRVHLELEDLVVRLHDGGEPKERRLHRVEVHDLGAARALEQRERLQSTQHATRQRAREGHDAERDVLHDLDVDAAQAHHQARDRTRGPCASR